MSIVPWDWLGPDPDYDEQEFADAVVSDLIYAECRHQIDISEQCNGCGRCPNCCECDCPCGCGDDLVRCVYTDSSLSCWIRVSCACGHVFVAREGAWLHVGCESCGALCENPKPEGGE